MKFETTSPLGLLKKTIGAKAAVHQVPLTCFCPILLSCLATTFIKATPFLVVVRVMTSTLASFGQSYAATVSASNIVKQRGILEELSSFLFVPHIGKRVGSEAFFCC